MAGNDQNNSADKLREKMKPNQIIKLLRIKHILNYNDKESLLEICNEREKTVELLITLIKKDGFDPIPQLKIALIKTGQSELLQYLVHEKKKSEDEDWLKSYYGNCFIHLQDDTYVAAIEYRNQMYIHVRNYENKHGMKIPTNKGVGLTFS